MEQSGDATANMREAAVTPEYFCGAVSFEQRDDWVKPWRLPFHQARLFPSPDEGLLARAEMPAGVRVR
ncbi:MAG: hypothetical protein QHJ73_13965, partial [Armatimonadota bacterium]|nr:hypothetical protein [Armatimonadota bacterium]